MTNEKQLAEYLASTCDLPEKKTREVLEEMQSYIMLLISQGEPVNLAGFGKFIRQTRKGRMSVHPRTLEPLRIDDCKVVKFRPSKRFKDLVKD